ncbi:alpha/beta hydrolase [Alphaproteobacteria bacterium]|nr:alpha/beta hydrolase [Alphaproteobacteria bacterium]
MNTPGYKDFNCDFSIFSKRDATRENIKNTTAMKFKSTFSEDEFSIPTMLYEPENSNGNIMLYLHGGGWVKGGIDSHDCLCGKIANALNIRVVSVEYRLAPQYKFPVALNDALDVYCGLCEKIDFENIVLAGDSSGGNLCAAICIKLREIKFHHLPSEQILFYPVLSNNFNSDSFLKFGHEINLTKSMMQWFVYQYTGKDPEDKEMLNNKLLYPILENDMSVFPKTIIVSAEKDVLFDGQSLFAKKLQNAGVEVDRITIKDSKHGFMTFGESHAKYAKVTLDWLKNIRI